MSDQTKTAAKSVRRMRFVTSGSLRHHLYVSVDCRYRGIVASLLESRLMGRLLEKAVAEASKLPEAEQEAVGAWILAELESERRWDDLFARSQDMLSEMAA